MLLELQRGTSGVWERLRGESAILRKQSTKQLEALMMGNDDVIASLAAWELVRLNLQTIWSVKNSKAAAAHQFSWFGGFLLGRLKTPIPPSWLELLKGSLPRNDSYSEGFGPKQNWKTIRVNVDGDAFMVGPLSGRINGVLQKLDSAGKEVWTADIPVTDPSYSPDINMSGPDKQSVWFELTKSHDGSLLHYWGCNGLLGNKVGICFWIEFDALTGAKRRALYFVTPNVSFR